MIQTLSQAFTRLARATQVAQTSVDAASDHLQSIRIGAPRGPRMRRPDHPVRQVPNMTTVAAIRGPERSRDWRAQMH